MAGISIDGKLRDPFIAAAGGTTSKIWNFKGNNPDYYPFPSTFDEFILKDSGVNSVGINFYDNCPVFAMRAYTQKTLLMELTNVMSKAFEGFKVAGEVVEGDTAGGASTGSTSKTKFDEFKELAKQVSAAFRSPIFMDYMSEIIAGKMRNLSEFEGFGGSGRVEVKRASILELPYILYYKLLGATTNNTYYFPAFMNEGFLKSDGSYGWGKDTDFAGGFNFGKGLLPGALGLISRTIGLTLTPMFNAGEGNAETIDGLKLTIELINDTKERAEKNYQLVQTLILNNMWVQDGFARVPASIYDIIIPGGLRLLMCTGVFNVSFKGTLRKFKGETNANRYIPDAYSLDLTFKSLLPNNFNNYIISIAKTQGQQYFSGSGDYDCEAEKFYEALKGIGNELVNLGKGYLQEETLENLKNRLDMMDDKTDTASDFTEKRNIYNEIGDVIKQSKESGIIIPDYYEPVINWYHNHKNKF